MWDETEGLGESGMLQGFVVTYPENNGKTLKNFNLERQMGGSELHLRTSSLIVSLLTD